MYLYAGRREEAIERAEKGIRFSPSDPRLFLWLPALAGAHYQLRHYEEAVEALVCRARLYDGPRGVGRRHQRAGGGGAHGAARRRATRRRRHHRPDLYRLDDG